MVPGGDMTKKDFLISSLIIIIILLILLLLKWQGFIKRKSTQSIT